MGWWVGGGVQGKGHIFGKMVRRNVGLTYRENAASAVQHSGDEAFPNYFEIACSFVACKFTAVLASKSNKPCFDFMRYFRLLDVLCSFVSVNKR